MEDYNLAWKERNTNIKCSVTSFCALGEYAKQRKKFENCPISPNFGRNKKIKSLFHIGKENISRYWPFKTLGPISCAHVWIVGFEPPSSDGPLWWRHCACVCTTPLLAPVDRMYTYIVAPIESPVSLMVSEVCLQELFVIAQRCIYKKLSLSY